MKGQHVKLITRQIGISDDDPAEVVTAVVVGDQRLELPMGSDLKIEYRGAGDSIAEVHVVLIAATVRYEPEGGWVIMTEPHTFEPDDGIRRSCCDQPRNAKIHKPEPPTFTGVETVEGLPAGDGRVVDGTDHSWCCPLDDPCTSHKLRFSPGVPADHPALSEYKYDDPEA